MGDTVKPFVDSTGLKERLTSTSRGRRPEMLARVGPGGVNIYDAVEKELGLKLALETAPEPVLIVDAVNEAPTPNPPIGQAQCLRCRRPRRSERRGDYAFKAG